MLTNHEKQAMKFYICSHSSYESRLEQLAEECAELAQVAQKMARYRRNEQPVAEDFNYNVAFEHLKEEFADILLCAYMTGINDEQVVRKVMDEKLQRWYGRMTKKQGNQPWNK